MAKVLTKHDFASPRRQFPKEWFDGKIRKVTAQDFGGAEPKTKRPGLRTRARLMGLQMVFDVRPDGSMVIQAVKRDDPRLEPKANGASKKRRRKKA